jgi:hypothetical protein
MRVLFLPLLFVVVSLEAQFEPEKSTFIGGTAVENFTEISSAPGGGVYCAGSTYSAGLASPGAFQSTNAGQDDAIICKFDESMNLLWSTYFGTSGNEFPSEMAVLEDGNVVVVGSTTSQNGIYAPGGLSFSTGNGFILMLDENGNRLWSSYFYPLTNIRFVVAYPGGDFIVAGSANDNSNIATPDSQQTSSAGGGDCFITRITATGDIVWSRYFGGPGSDGFNAMVCDGEYIYCAGNTTSTEGIAFNTTEGSVYNGGDRDGLLVKLDGDGNVIKSRYFGGEGFDSFNGVDVSEDALVLIGRSDSSAGINFGTHIALDIPVDGSATFVARMNSELELNWCTYHDDSAEGTARSVYADVFGQVWVLGTTSDDQDFEVNSGTFFGGIIDGMIARFQPDGELAMCAYTPAGSQEDRINSGTLSGTYLYVTGFTYSSDFSVSEDAWQTDFAGQSDGILMRFALPVGVEEWSVSAVSPVYPNPAVDQLTIPVAALSEVTEIQLVDLTGRALVHHAPVPLEPSVLHIASLSPGVYALRAFNAAGQALWTQRWVKE